MESPAGVAGVVKELGPVASLTPGTAHRGPGQSRTTPGAGQKNRQREAERLHDHEPAWSLPLMLQGRLSASLTRYPKSPRRPFVSLPDLRRLAAKSVVGKWWRNPCA